MTTTLEKAPAAREGLDDVIAAQTGISRVDEGGELWIGGIPVEELAPRASFEETAYLLWHDTLPKPTDLDSFRAALAHRRVLPPGTRTLLEMAAAREAGAMDALRMAAASLGLEASGDDRADAELLLAALPTAIAAYARLGRDLEPVAPDAQLGHAENFLFMLDGERPDARRARGLETYLNTVVDHGLNASTFTARVIVSTASDLVSAVCGAIGALKGPLHGGAPGPALDLVFEIGRPERAREVLAAKVAAGDRLMGFGHRVYRVRDPRAEVLSQAAARLYSGSDEEGVYRLATAVERTAVEVLAELKPGRRLDTNVEFYTALLLHGLGLGSDLFTPIFAMSRVAGWIAHCFEQRRTGRLIRPRAAWVGKGPRPWVPLEER